MALNMFNDPADCMNKTCVKVYIDSGYERNVNQYFLDNNIQPNYEVVGEDCLSVIPIMELCEILIDGVPFTFVDSVDVLPIIQIITDYENSVKEFGVHLGNTDIDDTDRNVLELCDKAKVKLFQVVERERLRNPNFKGIKQQTLADIIPNNIRGLQ